MGSILWENVFGQVFLLLIGAVLGVLGNILQGTARKVLLGVLSFLLVTTGALWIGYNIGVADAQNRFPNGVAGGNSESVSPTAEISAAASTTLPTTPSAAAIDEPTTGIVDEPATSPDEPSLGLPTNCIDGTILQLLGQPWRLESPGNGDAQAEQTVAGNVLVGKDTVRITYDLHGIRFGVGERRDESAIIFQQPNWHVINLANYGVNGQDGEQTIYVPITDFVGLPDEGSGNSEGTILDSNQEVIGLRARLWNQQPFQVDITDISVCNGQ